MEGKTCSRYGNVDNCRSSCQRFLALKPRWTARWSSTSTGWSFSKVLQLKQPAMSACARFTVNEMHSSCSLHPQDQIQEMLVQISRSSSNLLWLTTFKWRVEPGPPKIGLESSYIISGKWWMASNLNFFLLAKPCKIWRNLPRIDMFTSQHVTSTTRGLLNHGFISFWSNWVRRYKSVFFFFNSEDS